MRRSNIKYFSGWKQIIQAEVEAKKEAPGGASLLQIVGNIYVQVKRYTFLSKVVIQAYSLLKEAKAASNRFYRFAYGIQKTGSLVSDVWGLIGYVFYSCV